MSDQDLSPDHNKTLDEAGLLHAAVIEISAADNVDTALTAVLRRVCEKTGWILGQAWLPSVDATKLQCSAVWVDEPGTRKLEEFVAASSRFTFLLGDGLPGRVWTEKKPAWILDIPNDENFPRAPFAKSAGLTSALGIPVLAGEEVIAVLEFFACERREEDDWQAVLIASVAAQLGWTLRTKRSQEALRASEERYRALVENAPFCIHEIDQKRNLTAVNPAGLRMLGKAQIGGVCGLSALDLVSANDQQRISKLLDRAFAGQFSEFEFQTVDTNGEPRTFLSCFIPLYNKDGEIRTVLGTSQDVTNHRRAEEELRQAQKMESLGRLAGGVAHDFNNILNVIIGYAYLLQGGASSEKVDQAASAIRQAAERATTLTRQMLAFSRKHVLNSEAKDLNTVVSSISGMLRRMIGEDIELIVEPAEDPVSVTADVGQIEQIIMNLAINARDAMPEGGKLTIVTKSVELRGKNAESLSLAPARYAVLVVSDNGHGMDAKTQARAFEPFFTTKDPGQGTGLGLATVLGIVRQSGGQLSLKSSIGQGTTFTIYLPGTETRAAVEVIPSAPPPAKRRSETVLLVEDEESVRKLTKQLLQVQGYTVLEAAAGSAALDAASRHSGNIDLLVSDMVMPGMNGRELAFQLRRQCPGIKVLFVTGYAEASLFVDADAGVLEKPFTPDELSNAVREILSADSFSETRDAQAG